MPVIFFIYQLCEQNFSEMDKTLRNPLAPGKFLHSNIFDGNLKATKKMKKE